MHNREGRPGLSAGPGRGRAAISSLTPLLLLFKSPRTQLETGSEAGVQLLRAGVLAVLGRQAADPAPHLAAREVVLVRGAQAARVDLAGLAQRAHVVGLRLAGIEAAGGAEPLALRHVLPAVGAVGHERRLPLSRPSRPR